MTAASSDAITEGVRVRVKSFYVPERSKPKDALYFFAYRVQISNEGSDTVRLLGRHWIIEDGRGVRREVRGPGVVGEQPQLAPGKSYEYTSACPLPTRLGFMRGTYEMQREDGTRFDAEIAKFALLLPGVTN